MRVGIVHPKRDDGAVVHHSFDGKGGGDALGRNASLLQVTHEKEIKVAHGALRVVARQRRARRRAAKEAEAAVADAALHVDALRQCAAPRRANKGVTQEVFNRVGRVAAASIWKSSR